MKFNFKGTHLYKTLTNERGTWAMTALAVVGTAVNMYGQYAQGQATKKMNKYQADVAAQQQMLNARAAEANTTAVQYNASQESKALAKKQAAAAGAQAAGQAAGGVDGVTLADIQLDTFDTGKLDQMAVQYNADMKSWGIQQQLGGENWNLESQRTQYKMAGKNAVNKSYIDMASTLVAGASQAGGTYLKYKV